MQKITLPFTDVHEINTSIYDNNISIILHEADNDGYICYCCEYFTFDKDGNLLLHLVTKY